MPKTPEEQKKWRAEYRAKNRAKLQEQARKSFQKNYAKNAELMAEKRKSRTANLRKLADEIKSTRGCDRCPERHPACLDFHHRDEDSKELSIAMICKRARSVENLLDEIKKCDVLCSNCHRKEHYTRRTGIKVSKSILAEDAAVLALREVGDVLAKYRGLL